MLIAGNQLEGIIKLGYIDADLACVNASSIDVHLGSDIITEDLTGRRGIVDLDSVGFKGLMRSIERGYELQPGEFCLAATEERFNLPDHISAEFSLRSSIARAGLNHMNACWIDAGFFGALTLELQNCLQNHSIIIKKGARIGQVKFFSHLASQGYSYKLRGRYNGFNCVQASKGAES